MTMEKFDAVIIGTGQSGPFMAKRFSKAGKKVAIIEEGSFGGSCVNYGCTPSKTLVANAKIMQSVRDSSRYGVDVEHFELDFKKSKKRKDFFVRESSQWIEKNLKSQKGVKVFKGHGSFEGPNRIRVKNHLLDADKIFIDVGSSPRIPEIPGLEKIPYLTNVSLLEIEYLPEHLLILGGGYIGIEFAQIFRRFGSRVTVIHNHPVIMPKEDRDVSKEIEKILTKEGIKICCNTKNLEILPGSKEGKIHLQFDQNGKRKKISGSHLMVAVGRTPNTKNLGLEKAGVKVDKKGFIVVDDELRTTQPHIWAFGDCNGKGAFTHTSYNDYEIASENIFDNGSRKVSDRILIYGLFIDPPLGRVGMNEQQALDSGKQILSAKLPMSEVARAREKGETDGFLKILVDGKTKHILGASFLGTGCDELIHMIAVLMYAKMPYPIIQKTVHIHPTVSELVPTLLEKLKPLK